jgi:cob(I)alamin adenosyltransferase
MARLTKIYTRTGDAGTTSLGNGERVSKNDPRINLCGDLDECNSSIGILIENVKSKDVLTFLSQVQNDLFDIGAQVTFPDYQAISQDKINYLESYLDGLNAELKPLEEFVKPRGPNGAAYCHLSRSIARRCERTAWELKSTQELDKNILIYLNRLSDCLFVLARSLCERDSAPEMWTKN